MNPAPPPQGDEAEARLFGDSLSCDVELPVAVEPASSRGRQAQAITLLSALAQIEDLRKKDDAGEEHGDLPLLAQRMDAKLDLILALVGRLASRAPTACRSIRCAGRARACGSISTVPGI